MVLETSLRKKVREVLEEFGADPELIDTRGLPLHQDATEMVVAEVGLARIEPPSLGALW